MIESNDGTTVNTNRPALRSGIEEALFNLSDSQAALVYWLETRRGAALSDLYQYFISDFRKLVYHTSSLQELQTDNEQSFLKEIDDFVQPFISKHAVNSLNGIDFEKRAVRGVNLADRYRKFLGQKGIVRLGD